MYSGGFKPRRTFYNYDPDVLLKPWVCFTPSQIGAHSVLYKFVKQNDERVIFVEIGAYIMSSLTDAETKRANAKLENAVADALVDLNPYMGSGDVEVELPAVRETINDDDLMREAELWLRS